MSRELREARELAEMYRLSAVAQVVLSEDLTLEDFYELMEANKLPWEEDHE